jgi:helix-turn-helix protein
MQRRWKLSPAQRADMWGRWKAGQSLHAIGRALGKDQHVIHFLLARHGGIAPPVRRCSPRALTLAEREDISRGIVSGYSMRVIAKGLDRVASTLSREVARHGGYWELGVLSTAFLYSPHQRGLNRTLTAKKLDPATHGFGRRRAVRYGLVGAIIFLRERGLFVWSRAFRAASRLETDSIWNDRALVRNRPTLDSRRSSSHAW